MPKSLLCGVLILLAAGVTAATAAPPVDATLRVDPARTFQTVEGFGASGGWWAQDVGTWPAEQRDPILDLLYGTNGTNGASGASGAGLAIYRYNVGGARGSPDMPPADGIRDPWRRAFSVETAPGNYDFSRDAAALSVLASVRARDVREFVLFANSPPADLTINGVTSGGEDGGPNLPEANEDAFAERFVATCRAIAEKYDLPKVTLSPINEPDVTWGKDGRTQEGCFYPPEQVARVLAKVAAEMGKAGLSPARYSLDGPEVSSWGRRGYFDALLHLRANDPPLKKWLGRVVCHSYGGDDADRRWLARRVARVAPGLPIAMSEWTELKWGRDVGMDSALVLADVMTRDLTLGNAVSWQKWIAVSKHDYRDGLIYIDAAARSFTPTKRLWAMAQWARFVPPGSVRLAAEVVGDGQVLASAFRRPGEAGVACVAVNRGDRPVRLAVAGIDGRWQAFVTDAERDVAELDAVGGGVVTLPPRSVTTLVPRAD